MMAGERRRSRGGSGEVGGRGCGAVRHDDRWGRVLRRVSGIFAVGWLLAAGLPAGLWGQDAGSPVAVEPGAWVRDYLSVAWLRGEAGRSGSRDALVSADLAASLLCGEGQARGACDRLLRGYGAGDGMATRVGAWAALADEGAGTIGAALSLLGGNWGIRVLPGVSTGKAETFEVAHLSAGWRVSEHVLLMAGRAAFSFGPGVMGGLVRGAADTLGYAAVQVRALTLPRGFGEADLFSSLSRLSADRPGSPRAWWWTTRLVYAPVASLELALNRSVLFGGEGAAVLDPSVRRILYMLIGKHNTVVTDSGAFDFDNQIVSFDVVWRLPGLPVAVYGEWGGEDSSGSFARVPGWRLGGRAAWAGGFRGYAGLEFGGLSRSRDGNPPWYTHGTLGAYVNRGRPLGHPLGGHGWELRGTVFASDRDARWRVRATLFQREREAENALGPFGRSTGGSLRLELEPYPGFEIVANGDFEAFRRSELRDETGFSLGVRYVHGPAGFSGGAR